GAHRAAPPTCGIGGRLHAGVVDRLGGGGERKAMRGIRESDELAVANGVVAKTFHFGGNAHRIAACVEYGDRSTAAAAGQERVPRRGDVVADRRDEADAGDRDASSPSHGRTPAPSILGPISTRALAPLFPSARACRE